MKRVRRSAWVALATLAIALLLGLALASDTENRRGSEFTEEQRRFLTAEEPRGVFTSRHTFRTCRAGQFTYYYADWAYVITQEQCWAHLLPVVPSFLPTRP